jgi:hypothetical protein
MVEPMTWVIDREDNRKVSIADEWEDTIELGKEKREAMRTADVIREIHYKLKSNGAMNQSSIIESLAGIHGERVIKRVLVSQAEKHGRLARANTMPTCSRTSKARNCQNPSRKTGAVENSDT